MFESSTELEQLPLRIRRSLSATVRSSRLDQVLPRKFRPRLALLTYQVIQSSPGWWECTTTCFFRWADHRRCTRTWAVVSLGYILLLASPRSGLPGVSLRIRI